MDSPHEEPTVEPLCATTSCEQLTPISDHQSKTKEFCNQIITFRTFSKQTPLLEGIVQYCRHDTSGKMQLLSGQMHLITRKFCCLSR